MRRSFLLQSALAFALVLAAVVGLGRLVGQAGPLAVDLGGRAPFSLSPATRDYLAPLDRRLSLTLFVSPREQMPPRLKDVEAGVRQLLKALQEEAPDRVEYRVLDPTASGAAGAQYAARRKVSPVRVSQVERDERAEAEVWSSLVVSLEGYPDVLVQDIRDTHLPHLEGLVLEHLRALEHPVQPSFAVAAPPGYGQLAILLSQSGPVIEVDLDRGDSWPDDVDLLFWIQPARVTAAHLAALRRFVASGRSAVLAGSAYDLDYQVGADGQVALAPRLQGHAWADLLGPFGLRPVPDLLMDRNTGPVSIPLPDGAWRPLELPVHLRNLPAFRDFHRFRSPARGGVSFAAASALEVDPARARQAGFPAEVVATTTEHAWVRPLTPDPLRPDDLSSGLPVPKQNLMVLLAPDDPWSGQILVLASASCWRDGIADQAGYGHAVLARDLVRTFCDPERLVRMRVDRAPPPPLPPLSPAARLWWRAVAILGGPAAVAALGLWRRRRAGPLRPPRALPAPSPELRWMAGAAAALLLLLASGLLARLAPVATDWTADRANTPDPGLRRLLAAQAGELGGQLVLSPEAALPPELKGLEARVRRHLPGVALAVVHPEALGPAARQNLARLGLGPFPVERVRADTLVTAEVWSGLVLRRQDRVAVVPRLDAAAAGHLDFLVAAALRRLTDGRAPVVAAVSDVPRLSPAEALEDYQRQGLSAPQGEDVYSRAKARLADYGYDVRHVSLREPRLPDGTDMVVWFQPRRDAGALIEMLSSYLARGGRALVALQHYNIQQRQYRGAGFETVYWPQPQFQDFDRYLRLLGVEQVREVLMDRTRHHLRLDTQVNRTAVREYDPQEVALPFLVRTVPAHYDAASPVTRGLGDLLFIWGNRFAFDASALAAAGLRHQVLVTTSASTWAYDWRGGWLPPEVLEAPAATLAAQPLVAVLEGPFPAARPASGATGDELQVVSAAGAARPGWLCLVGSSEMFKDDRLDLPGFEPAQLLLNAVALATYGADLALLQGRHRAPRGFAYQTPATKAYWRAFVLVAGPLAFAAAGLLRFRRRRPRRSAS
ncbi:MAG: Gldg family protein [Gemmatimonadota bacterium]